MTQDKFTFAKGTFEVRAAEAYDGTHPSWDFFYALPESDRAKLQSLFQYIASIGQIKNKEKFKKIEGTNDLFEFKQFQIRMPCFWTRNGVLFITHGFIKKQDRTPESEKSKANEIMAAQRARVSKPPIFGEARR